MSQGIVKQDMDLTCLKLPPHLGSKLKGREDLASWVGGSIVAKHIFVDRDLPFMTRSDYEEYGPSAVARK